MAQTDILGVEQMSGSKLSIAEGLMGREVSGFSVHDSCDGPWNLNYVSGKVNRVDDGVWT